MTELKNVKGLGEEGRQEYIKAFEKIIPQVASITGMEKQTENYVKKLQEMFASDFDKGSGRPRNWSNEAKDAFNKSINDINIGLAEGSKI